MESQHSKQLTVNARNDDGDSVLRRQVSTKWEALEIFFQEFQQLSHDQGGYVAVVEVCGFNDWLIERLPKWGCKEVILVQPEERQRQKTDRRDANRLSELLWINRERLLNGRRVQGIRRVYIPTQQERDDRRITALRRNVGTRLTRAINAVRHLLRRHNLEQDCPTKGIQTQAARKWLKALELSELDRLEMNYLLALWESHEKERDELEKTIAARQVKNKKAATVASPGQLHLSGVSESRHDCRQKPHSSFPRRRESSSSAHGINWIPAFAGMTADSGDLDAIALVASLFGAGAYTSLGLASRVGPIDRFPRPRSLSNYFGVTPGSRNSGEATQRLGSITKRGSAMARFLLGQLVLHVLRRDPQMRKWYKGIKKRRGAKIARVAVMRRLVTIIWHMLKYDEAYVPGGPPRLKLPATAKG